MLPWLIFGLFGFYLVGNNFSAKLGMIDDHEIAMFLGFDGVIKLSEIPSVIMTTEVGQWGTNLRYRPSYYTLRVIETALWRDNALAWYASRYIMLVVSMVIGFMIASIFFPQIVAYLFIFYTMTMPFWPDVMTRLGPSEIYAVPALLLLIYGLIKNKFSWIFWGYIICVGGKENLLVLLPIFSAWVIVQRKNLKFSHWIGIFIMAVFTTLIVSSILIATDKTQVDFYLNDIGYSDRILKTLESIPQIIASRHLMIPLIIFAFLSFVVAKKYFLLGATILLLALTQYVFYNNKLPTNTRYDFPALLLFPIFDLVTVKMMIEATKQFAWGKYFKTICYIGLCLFLMAYVVRRGYTLIHASAEKNASWTGKFSQNLKMADEKMKENPQTTIIFVSNHFTDFEGMISVARYLTALRNPNKFAIHYTREKLLEDTLGQQLEERMIASMNGDVQMDQTFARFSQIPSPVEPCYSITFYSAPEIEQCPVIAKF